MMIVLRCIVGIGILLSVAACAAASSEPPNESESPSSGGISATSLPAPEPAATATAALIAVASLNSETQADGTVVTTVKVQDNQLGIGEVLLKAPSGLDLGESGIVTLTIFPSVNAEAALEPLTETGTTDPQQEQRATTALYPVMMADLTGSTFVIDANGDAQRLVTTDTPTEWVWSITPSENGSQTLIASLSVPVSVEGASGSLSRTVQTFPITIAVDKTFSQRVEDNMGVLLTTAFALIGGGVSLGARAWRNRRGSGIATTSTPMNDNARPNDAGRPKTRKR